MNVQLLIYIFVFNFICQTSSFGFIKTFFNIIQRDIYNRRSKIKNINGFYGLVGPDVDMSKVKTLYELFTGDGIINGVFLENGVITQVSHKIQTEKINYEDKNGKFMNYIPLRPVYMLLTKMGILPNTMGLANTAFIKVLKRFFVLFERDLPYEIAIDFENKSIATLNKMNIQNIENFSAHSKVETDSGKIYSLQYNVVFNIVACLILNTEMKVIKKIMVKSKYVPIVHDLWFLDKSNSTMFTDSPLEFSFKYMFSSKIPIVFNNNKPTYIRIISHKDSSQTVYYSKTAFYIFHYADVVESKNNIQIYAPLYLNIEFDKLKIQGKYRVLILDKKTKKITMYENPELEIYNLDFPVKWKDNVILRNIKRNRINGFVICKGITIVRRIFLKERYIYGEHALYEKNNVSRIMCFGYDDTNCAYFFLINPENGEVFEFPLKNSLNIGFHSIFIPEKKKETNSVDNL